MRIPHPILPHGPCLFTSKSFTIFSHRWVLMNIRCPTVPCWNHGKTPGKSVENMEQILETMEKVGKNIRDLVFWSWKPILILASPKRSWYFQWNVPNLKNPIHSYSEWFWFFVYLHYFVGDLVQYGCYFFEPALLWACRSHRAAWLAGKSKKMFDDFHIETSMNRLLSHSKPPFMDDIHIKTY